MVMSSPNAPNWGNNGNTIKALSEAEKVTTSEIPLSLNLLLSFRIWNAFWTADAGIYLLQIAKGCEEPWAIKKEKSEDVEKTVRCT